MTFELTVTLQIQSDTLGQAVTEIEDRIRHAEQPSVGLGPVRLSAMTGKVITTKEEK